MENLQQEIISLSEDLTEMSQSRDLLSRSSLDQKVTKTHGFDDDPNFKQLNGEWLSRWESQIDPYLLSNYVELFEKEMGST